MAKLGLGDARIGFLREELRSSQDRERFQSPGRRETRSNIRMIIIIMSTVWGRTGVRNDQALRPTHTHTHGLPGARAHRQSFSSGVCKRRYPQDRRPRPLQIVAVACFVQRSRFAVLATDGPRLEPHPMPDSGFSRPDENSTASGVLTPAAAPSTVYRRIRLSGKLRPSVCAYFMSSWPPIQVCCSPTTSSDSVLPRPCSL